MMQTFPGMSVSPQLSAGGGGLQSRSQHGIQEALCCVLPCVSFTQLFRQSICSRRYWTHTVLFRMGDRVFMYFVVPLGAAWLLIGKVIDVSPSLVYRIRKQILKFHFGSWCQKHVIESILK